MSNKFDNKFNAVSEVAGQVVGAIVAPLVFAGSLIRHARLLHPEGVCYSAKVAALTTTPELTVVAQRLAGAALVRLSSAMWRGGKELPDVLGCAVRFGVSTPITAQAPADAQDLLFATSPRVWTLPLALLWSNAHDFLDNAYYGIAPFELDELGLVRLELIPQPGVTSPGLTRPQRLLQSVASGHAVFVLRVQRLAGPQDWIPLVEVRLQEPLRIDEESLRFSPFRNGCGIRPRGFIHSLRRAIYASSQLARPKA